MTNVLVFLCQKPLFEPCRLSLAPNTCTNTSGRLYVNYYVLGKVGMIPTNYLLVVGYDIVKQIPYKCIKYKSRGNLCCFHFAGFQVQWVLKSLEFVKEL